jgi:uncharacterized protein YbgA (DUF1722 family)/uncharacterized protein YbbK (DUF523 family)
MTGRPVRFDGAAKKSSWVTDVLAQHAELVPVCPEMAMGLGAPREAVRLVRENGSTTLRGAKSGKDYSARAADIASALLRELPELDGVVLQKNSPTCGLERVRVYDHNGVPTKTGQGGFAAALQAGLRGVPIIEEGRLNDEAQRTHFLTQIFALARFRTSVHDAASLQAFHATHKMLLYSHSPQHYRAAGRVAATGRTLPWGSVRGAYRSLLARTLAEPPTVGRRVNAFHHIMGFFKNGLEPDEKLSLLEAIDAYRAGTAPFAVPLALLGFLARRFESDYIASQRIFTPFPASLSRGYL